MKRQNKSGRAERVLGACMLLLLIAALWLSHVGGPKEGLPKSVGSYMPDGRAGVYHVLDRLAFEPQAWVQAPQFLPNSGGVLWMPAVPVEGHGVPPQRELDASQDPRNPELYGEFVRAGGSLILPYSPSGLAWLRESCSLIVPDWQPTERTETFEVSLDSGETLSVHSEPSGPTDRDESVADVPEADQEAGEQQVEEATESTLVEYEIDPLSEWFDFAIDREDRAFISWSSQGYGRVVLLAGDGWLLNSALDQEDNAILLVRLAEALRGPSPFLFDEFALGLWVPRTKLDLVASPSLLPVTVQLFLVALVFVLLYAWVREFHRDPKRPRLDPRLRVQAQVAWLQRAGRYDILAQDLRQGVLARMLRRLGSRPAERKLSSAQRLQVDLDSVALQLPTKLDQSPWRTLFAATAIDSKQDLEQLGSDLRHFEQWVQAARTNRPNSSSKES